MVVSRLQLPDPWNSVVLYAVFPFAITVVVCWCAFCLAFAIFLRKRSKVGSLKQIAVLFGVAVPIWGIRYYERTVQRLTFGTPVP